ncbi:MAG TPA: hypothetical protein VGN53_10685 [Klebsiella sp.]|jgi:hypothetical protein
MKDVQDSHENQRNYVVLLLALLFGSSAMESVRTAILSLIEIQKKRIPPLVDSPTEHFPECETLRQMTIAEPGK